MGSLAMTFLSSIFMLIRQNDLQICGRARPFPASCLLSHCLLPSNRNPWPLCTLRSSITTSVMLSRPSSLYSGELAVSSLVHTPCPHLVFFNQSLCIAFLICVIFFTGLEIVLSLLDSELLEIGNIPKLSAFSWNLIQYLVHTRHSIAEMDG